MSTTAVGNPLKTAWAAMNNLGISPAVRVAAVLPTAADALVHTIFLPANPRRCRLEAGFPRRRPVHMNNTKRK